MSINRNTEIANLFLARIGKGASPEEIAGMFSESPDWNIPGDSGVFPWVGHQTGREAVLSFVRQSASMIERIDLQVHEILASENRAIIYGELASRVVSTGKVIETPWTIVLTISQGLITRFLMLEDSFAVALAAGSSKLHHPDN